MHFLSPIQLFHVSILFCKSPLLLNYRANKTNPLFVHFQPTNMKKAKQRDSMAPLLFICIPLLHLQLKAEPLMSSRKCKKTHICKWIYVYKCSVVDVTTIFTILITTHHPLNFVFLVFNFFKIKLSSFNILFKYIYIYFDFNIKLI